MLITSREVICQDFVLINLAHETVNVVENRASVLVLTWDSPARKSLNIYMLLCNHPGLFCEAVPRQLTLAEWQTAFKGIEARLLARVEFEENKAKERSL